MIFCLDMEMGTPPHLPLSPLPLPPEERKGEKSTTGEGQRLTLAHDVPLTPTRGAEGGTTASECRGKEFFRHSMP
jgi:hypothetical protein